MKISAGLASALHQSRNNHSKINHSSTSVPFFSYSEKDFSFGKVVLGDRDEKTLFYFVSRTGLKYAKIYLYYAEINVAPTFS